MPVKSTPFTRSTNARFTTPHIAARNDAGEFFSVSLAPAEESWPDAVIPAAGLFSWELLAAMPALSAVDGPVLKCASQLQIMQQGAQMMGPDDVRLTGTVSALRGAIKLRSKAEMVIIRELVEITFDHLQSGNDIGSEYASLLGGVVMTIDRETPGSIYDIAGLVLAVSGRKAVVVPLADFAQKAGIRFICPDVWRGALFEDQADVANSQALRATDFLLDMLRSNETLEEESKSRIFALTEVGVSNEMEEVG